MTIDEIIRRLEAGESGGRIEAAICAVVFPDAKPFRHDFDGQWLMRDGGGDFPPLPYTTSVDAAMGLAPEGHDIAISQASGPGRTDWYGYCEERDEYGRKPRHMGNAATPALALCIAALKARQAKT